MYTVYVKKRLGQVHELMKSDSEANGIVGGWGAGQQDLFAREFKVQISGQGLKVVWCHKCEDLQVFCTTLFCFLGTAAGLGWSTFKRLALYFSIKV